MKLSQPTNQQCEYEQLSVLLHQQIITSFYFVQA